MTWGDVKLAALQTMFSNEGVALNLDDINQEYIDAMPAKANEALQQICLVGRPLVKKWTITVSEEAEEAVDDGGVTLPAADVRYHLDMSKLQPRFRCVHNGQLMLETETGYGEAEKWWIEGDTVLVLPGSIQGTYTLYYRAYPQTIAADTADETVIDLPAEAAPLIALYIAGELYKDDDLSMATMFRNEYEDGLTKLRQAYDESSGGIGVTERKNTTGWW